VDTLIVTETAVESKSLTQPQFTLVTYDETFGRWLENQDRSERTIRLYRTGLADFRAWFERVRGKDLEPALITPLDVRAYRRYLQDERQAKPSTINSYLAAVRAFCRWATDAGLAAGDPSSGIKGIKIVEQSPRWLTRQEQYKVLNAAQERVQLAALKFSDDANAPGILRARRDRAIVVLMLNTGLRLSEVTGLKVKDITIRPRSGSVAVTAGKGNKARTVPLNKDAREALEAWIEVRGGEESEPLFTSQKGGQLTARAVARRVEYIGMCANVNITPHMLRHSLAKNLVDEGVPLDRVGGLLGHSSLDTTRRYTMPSAADLQAAVERVAWRD